jgi:predicted transcriptional regulator
MQETFFMNTAAAVKHPRRWGSRKQAMLEGQVGPTKLNEMMMDGRVIAKRLDGKVLVDLDSLQALYEGLPTVREQIAPTVKTRRQRQPSKAGAS